MNLKPYIPGYTGEQKIGWGHPDEKIQERVDQEMFEAIEHCTPEEAMVFVQQMLDLDPNDISFRYGIAIFLESEI